MRFASAILLTLVLGCNAPQPSDTQVESDFAKALPGAELLSAELLADEVGAADLRIRFTTLGGVPESELWHYVREPSGNWRLTKRVPE